MTSEAGKTLLSLAMIGGAGMDTDTPDTTRLTDEQVQESLSWLSRAQQAENHTVAVAIWANTYGHQLHAHIRTLTADLDRVEVERDRLREQVESAERIMFDLQHLGVDAGDLERTTARAAEWLLQNGSAPSSHCDICGKEIPAGTQWETFDPGDGSGEYVRCAACMPEGATDD